MKRNRIKDILLIILLSTPPLIGAPGTLIKMDGGEIIGEIIWQPASRRYMVTTKEGAQIPVPFQEVKMLNIQKPPNFDKAVEFYKNKQYDNAIPIFESILQVYANLHWDNEAAGYLGECYLQKGKHQEAEKMLKRIIDNNPKILENPTFAKSWWEILLKNGKKGQLKAELIKAIESGPRSLIAYAHVLRGDLEKESGQLETALIDGYLRTVILFKDCKDAREEALYKAALTFKDLGRARDAEKMRRILSDEYPNSKYIELLKQQL